MPKEYYVPLSDIINEYSLEVIYCPCDPKTIKIKNNDVNRPGLQLAGFYEYFDSTRIQIAGKAEFAFMEQLPEEKRISAFANLFSQKPPAFIVTRDLDLFPEIEGLAKENEVPLFRSKASTSEFMAALIAFLNLRLAPRITRHGVLIEI
ncbi:MAG: HPr kinase/phosphorylase, partial [Ruminiclostridium sp.]|nr:HPr kinase/phosphorylase [Ruminiclostridium sp.]